MVLTSITDKQSQILKLNFLARLRGIEITCWTPSFVGSICVRLREDNLVSARVSASCQGHRLTSMHLTTSIFFFTFNSIKTLCTYSFLSSSQDHDVHKMSKSVGAQYMITMFKTPKEWKGWHLLEHEQPACSKARDWRWRSLAVYIGHSHLQGAGSFNYPHRGWMQILQHQEPSEHWIYKVQITKAEVC